MTTAVKIVDETVGMRDTREWTLSFLDERVTVREIIRRRVYEEVLEYNASNHEYFQGLVQPTDAERSPNGYKLKTRRKIDWQAQFEQALEAFRRNGFIVLVNDRQVEDLDEIVDLTIGTEVTFLKLVPLVGG